MRNMSHTILKTNVLASRAPPPIKRYAMQNSLHRVMAFTGQSIDDIINSSIAKRRVFSYFKLHRWVQRRCEIVELEKQWSG